MKSLSKEIGKKLKAKKKTLALAESCTGGYLSHLITSVSGSSAYYKGGIVSYDNAVKVKILGVKKKTLQKFGAVSAECAKEMASGILKKLKTDYALATTGIAGPSGAVKGKPVGTVYIAFASKKVVLAERFQFKGGRLQVIKQTAQQAVEILASNL